MCEFLQTKNIRELSKKFKLLALNFDLQVRCNLKGILTRGLLQVEIIAKNLISCVLLQFRRETFMFELKQTEKVPSLPF